MPIITRTALVEHAANAIYELVCDVESYPEFLPWCSAAHVESRTDAQQVAAITISKFMAQSVFKTKNRLLQGQEIHMELVDGPFRYLKGQWHFKPLADYACKIELVVDFEFSSPVMAKMISPVFNSVCDTIVSSFVSRANALTPAQWADLGLGSPEQVE